MAKPKIQFHCTACGQTSPKWQGRCPGCGQWNTFEEELPPPVGTQAPVPTTGWPAPVALHDVERGGGPEIRLRTGIGELDNALGGGIVAGSLVLLGGDPGVGKSTLLLTVAHAFARKGLPVIYCSGEESVHQIRLRGERLGIDGHVKLLATTDLDHVEAAAKEHRPLLLVIDSVQTTATRSLDSPPGSMAQIREVAWRAMHLAKTSHMAVILVGHITKSGDLAGPKMLEHMVDTVLHFEGDGRLALRVLRTVKNRFGPSGEVGMFEMTEGGLIEVPDASARLLEERVHDAPGTAVVANLEGARPLLVEVQALAGRPTATTPARTVVGVDRARVLMLAAVLDKLGMEISDRDLFVNAVGGVKIVEPASDLGILGAIASSLLDRPVRDDTLLLGEVGLVGEVRSVPFAALRLKEAARHGFRRVVGSLEGVEIPAGIEVVTARTVRDALQAVLS